MTAALAMRKRWALIPLALVLSAVATWTDDPQPDGTRNSTVAAEQAVAASAPAPSPAQAGLPEFVVDRFPVQLAPQSLSVPPAPQAPLMPYRYVGQMTYEGATLAFLERRGNVLTARVGAILDSVYRVDAITSQSVRLAYLPLDVTQTALAADTSAAGDQPIDIVFTAPSEAAHGSIIDVSIGVPPHSVAQLANFRLTYDADALDLVEVQNASGATPSVIDQPPGTVELSYDRGEGTRELPTARFVAKSGDQPHSAKIAVTAELFDSTGRAITINSPAPHSVMLMP
jgi:hypothetical protein